MSTGLTWQIKSSSLEDTLELASRVGRSLKGGEVIELVSDLGGGKTSFVRGLAQGMGSTARVSSPSFTISNQYQTDTLVLHHFDFYRLSEAGIIEQELKEILNDPNAVVVVEWANIVQGVLPARRLTIDLKTTGENSRELVFNYPHELGYLLPINT